MSIAQPEPKVESPVGTLGLRHATEVDLMSRRGATIIPRGGAAVPASDLISQRRKRIFADGLAI